MSAMTKSERLAEMKRLYIQRAFTDMEMAERLGVDRTTVYRDRIELTGEYPIEPDEEGRYRIDRSKLISEIKVNLHEALALYLAARKSSRQTRFHQPHTVNALEKLAAVLRQPMTGRLLNAAGQLLQQEKNPERLKVIETIAQAWVEEKKVRIRYQGLKSKDVTNHVVSPYFIEPSIWSDSVYVVGYSDTFEKIMPFKIDRIDTAIISGESIKVLENFNDEELLRHAWGIWYGEDAPQQVTLKFRPGEAARRLKESKWHPLETVEESEDGGCIWRAEVAEWREMLPWVRGWGADVEVLEPEALRRVVVQHVRDMASQYKVMASETKPYSVLWAKADKKDLDKIHRLVYHLIDVGQVALAMWQKAIDAESKRQFCQWLGCDEDAAGRTLAFLISLHDLGKASPSFQIKVKTLQDEIRRAGFWLPDTKPAYTSPHGIVSAWALGLLLPDVLKISERDAKKLARAVGGHHGSWPLPLQLKNLNAADKGNDDPSWDAARRELVHIMAVIFDPIIAFTLTDEPEPQELNAFLTLFSGFTSVADWIGSMTEFFPYEKHTNIPLEEYTARAASNAEKALSELGWFNWQADGSPLAFAEMFPFIDSPNPVQQTIIQETVKTQLPALLILESPTGSGKTEAALYAADAWLQTKRGSGMYIAMPTQATSNQMYDRVTKFLCQRYPAETLNFHLVHGGALLEEKNKAQTESVYDEDQPDSQGGIRAEAWFLPRKRTLLAPFGVGTVDQALMSVLQTRHFFVRMFGLKNKVVIFDEVHAYDTYMSVLFKRLLSWLKQIGVSVVLLSATLPEKTRRELTVAYLGLEKVDVPPAEYPRLTIASGSSVRSIPLEPPSSRTVQLMLCDTQDQIIIEHLRTAMQNGGCAAVICNRVARAQELYREIKAAELVPAEDLILFHARFPFSWREEIETKVLGKFGKDKKGGKNPDRPKKSIVVATQVIEQSLDLDFDYMVSDLAPIDLIIQRAGRLHRHSQNDATRPGNLKTPALLVVFPQNEEIPAFGHDEYVYDRSVMLKTWLALKEKTAINLPEETTALIEAVYGGDIESQDEALQSALEAAVEKEEQGARSEVYKAKQQLIASPEYDDLLSNNNRNLDEDDPTVHHAFRAATRNSEPSVTLICLHRIGDEISLDPDGTSLLDISHKPEKDVVRSLLRQSVGVQKRVVVDYFTNHTPELSWKGWKEVAALKYAFPIVFEHGRYPLVGKKYILVLDRHTGLTIQKEEQ
jgi:CRISPR-associated endonuclease/helicase Cas3